MNWLKNNPYKLAVLAMGLAALLFVTYWYALRPSSIRKYCNSYAVEQSRPFKLSDLVNEEKYEDYYQRCLNQKGLE